MGRQVGLKCTVCVRRPKVALLSAAATRPCRRGRRRNDYAARPVDMSDVCTLEGEERPGVTRLGPVPGLPTTATAFAFAAHPGASQEA